MNDMTTYIVTNCPHCGLHAEPYESDDVSCGRHPDHRVQVLGTYLAPHPSLAIDLARAAQRWDRYRDR